MASAQDVVNGKIGKVLGADTYSPCTLEKTHPDFFWYGIHGVELLYTVMGIGCKSLVRVHTEGTDVTVGTWEDGRIGTFRGTRTGNICMEVRLTVKKGIVFWGLLTDIVRIERGHSILSNRKCTSKTRRYIRDLCFYGSCR